MISDAALRPYEDADADECVEVVTATLPWALDDLAGWRHMLASTPESARMARWVAVEHGRVVGFSSAFLTWWTTTPGAARGGVLVDPDAARHGIGGRLWELADAHLAELGATRVRMQAADSSSAFALERGFEVVSRKRISAVDPRTVHGRPDPRVVPYSELADRLEELYRLDVETTKDMPNEGEFELPFEQWRADFWEDPLLSQQGSFAAIVDGRLAAATNLRVNGTRAGNGFTGTLREFRRRGLATAVKTAALLWAAEHGVERVHTFNDETNAPMLAVNTKLGYRPWASVVDVERG